MQFNAVLEEIKAYEAGKPIELVVREYGIDENKIIKMASNENPYGTSPKVIEAVKNIVQKMYLYPDDSMYELKAALANHCGVAKENIIIGAGSDQVLEFATRAKLQPGQKVLMNSITFAMYEIYAKQCGAQIIRTNSMCHDVGEFLELYKKHRPVIVFLCLPNNPTGDALTRNELYEILDAIDLETLVIVDGAYMEYAAYKDPARKVEPSVLIARYPNALYLGTFSKAYGLGGMRVGYGIGQECVIRALYKLRPPFNITTLSLKAAIEALKDEVFVHQGIKKNFEEMERFEAFAKAQGIEYIDSFTNFITFMFSGNHNSKALSEALLKNGIIIRDLASYGLNAIRITIGTAKQNSRFFEVFATLL